jgi:hypothetical protein
MVNELLNVALLFGPLILIMLIANWAERLREQGQPSQPLVAVSFIAVALLYMVGLLVGTMFMLSTNLPNAPIQIGSPLWLFFGMVIPSLIGLLLLLRPVRQLVARFTQLDPDHPVHAVALALSMTPLLNLGFTLGIGLDNLSALLSQQAEQTGVAPISLASLWAQNIMFVLLALIGVGWLTRRSFGESLVRLGIVRPTLRHTLIGVATALVLIPTIPLLEAFFSSFGLGVSRDVETLTELLMGPIFTTPFGILTIGLAAGLGEEPLFRGAAQPRFGLVLTSILFALVHAQYGISLATLIVFFLGLVLGILRNHTNTTTAMLTHAMYNSGIGLLAYLGIQFLAQQP